MKLFNYLMVLATQFLFIVNLQSMELPAPTSSLPAAVAQQLHYKNILDSLQSLTISFAKAADAQHVKQVKQLMARIEKSYTSADLEWLAQQLEPLRTQKINFFGTTTTADTPITTIVEFIAKDKARLKNYESSLSTKAIEASPIQEEIINTLQSIQMATIKDPVVKNKIDQFIQDLAKKYSEATLTTVKNELVPLKKTPILYFGQPTTLSSILDETFFERIDKELARLSQPASQPANKLTTGQNAAPHPAWPIMLSGKLLNQDELQNTFKKISDQLAATENAKIPAKTADMCRIVTYNVHFWRNASGLWKHGKNEDEFKNIVNVISKIQPDILILQEVGGQGSRHWYNEFESTFKNLGYTDFTHCTTSALDPKESILSNYIVSKYPMKQHMQKLYTLNPSNPQAEHRCFTRASITLPNKKVISVYGTHLEVNPIEQNGKWYTSHTVRQAQLQELLSSIKEHDKVANIIIGADFNAPRKKDLEAHKIGNKSFWNIYQTQWLSILEKIYGPDLSAHEDQQPYSLDYFEQQGWQDSFEKSGFTPPQFTQWTGTRIDFLFLSPSWNLPLKGSYVYYDWASDHLPVIADIGL